MSLKRCESCGKVTPPDTPALRSIVYAAILVGGIILGAAWGGYYFVLGALAMLGVSFISQPVYDFLVTWFAPDNEAN